jgi:hypothetical protein
VHSGGSECQSLSLLCGVFLPSIALAS